MFEDYEKELREKAIRIAESAMNKQNALQLIQQLMEIEKTRDSEYVKLLAEKKIYLHGESAIGFGLKTLRELIQKI